MKSIKTPFVLTIIAAIAVTTAVVGCKKETATDKMKDTATDAKDAVKDAAVKTGEAVKDAATATKDAVTNAVGSMTATNK